MSDNILSLKSQAQATPLNKPERVVRSQELLGTVKMNSCLLVPCSQKGCKTKHARRHTSREFQGL